MCVCVYTLLLQPYNRIFDKFDRIACRLMRKGTPFPVIRIRTHRVIDSAAEPHTRVRPSGEPVKLLPIYSILYIL